MIDTDNSCRRCNPTCPENCEDCEKEDCHNRPEEMPDGEMVEK